MRRYESVDEKWDPPGREPGDEPPHEWYVKRVWEQYRAGEKFQSPREPVQEAVCKQCNKSFSVTGDLKDPRFCSSTCIASSKRLESRRKRITALEFYRERSNKQSSMQPKSV